MKRNSLKLSVIILLFVLFFNLLFSLNTSIYEILYFRSFFQLIRFLHDFSFGLLPIPSLYLVLSFSIAYLFRQLCIDRRSFPRKLLIFIIWTVSLFYILWAFNYNQENLRQVLKLNTSAIDSNYIRQSYLDQSNKLDSILSRGLKRDVPEDLEDRIREAQESILSEWGYPVYGRVRVRKIVGGSLLHFRTSGIYIPHAIEGHFDGGLYEIQHPFTLAHEMAHGYGVTDESECNFLAYLSCLAVDDWIINYSAELAYWRYLASYYKRLFPEEWKSEFEDLNPLLRKDLEEIRDHVMKFKDWMPEYRDLIYDRYLKTHGVKSGIRSYDEMIVLIKAYTEAKGS